ncbi:hypothetical protein O181_102423 [Austropuccinia psidii MF-1]|uniref:Uncharacterized protein n=1 Tax=Austropuccinia psidii MF-1 TaxID=1389203 RepID=A0A9Q3JID9_9BASI|nr:hypothetical protein [Austropuccinia psidii MF-1]
MPLRMEVWYLKRLALGKCLLGLMLARNALITVVFAGAFFIGRKFGFEIFKGNLKSMIRHLSIEGIDVWRKVLDMDNNIFGDSVEHFNKLFSECHVESSNYLQESTSGPLEPTFNHGMGTFNSGGGAHTQVEMVVAPGWNIILL